MQPVPLSEIKSITLDHMAGGGLTVSAQTVLSPIGVLAGIQSPDNWDMASLEVTAVGQGIGVVILRHGPKKFTGSDPVLNLRTEVPANSCASGGVIGSAIWRHRGKGWRQLRHFAQSGDVGWCSWQIRSLVGGRPSLLEAHPTTTQCAHGESA